MTLLALIVASWFALSVLTALAFGAVAGAAGRSLQVPTTAAAAPAAAALALPARPVALPAQRRSVEVPSAVG